MPGDAANMLTTTILQLVFKLMVKENMLKLAQAFRPSYPALVTQALGTFFIRFWNSFHIFGEDILVTFIRDSIRRRKIEVLLNKGF